MQKSSANTLPALSVRIDLDTDSCLRDDRGALCPGRDHVSEEMTGTFADRDLVGTIAELHRYMRHAVDANHR